MPTAIIRPNLLKSKTNLPTSPYDYKNASNWTGQSNTQIGDDSDATVINSPNNNAAMLTSYWDIPNQSWHASTIINSITVFARARYTATSQIYAAPESADTFWVHVDWASDFASNNIAASGPNISGLTKDLWTTYQIGSWPTKPNGQRWTESEIDAMSILVVTGGGTPTINNYQVQISDVWLVVDYSQPGTLTGGSATVTDTTTPLYSFTFSHPEEFLGSYEAKLFEFSETQKAGFDWLTSGKYLWSSGYTLVPSGSSVLTISLRPDFIHSNGRKYAMVARALPRSSNVAWSNHATTTRTIDILSSIAPRLAITPDETNKGFGIDVWREDNILSDNQSLFTTSLDGWASLSGGASVSLQSGTGYPNVAKNILSLSYTGSSDYEISCGVNSATPYNGSGTTAPFTAIAGEWHSFAMRFWTVGTTGTEYRNARLDIRWYDANNTLISQALGNVFRTIGGTWVYPSVTAKAPTSATKFAVILRMSGATGGSEFHILDRMDVHVGNVNVLENSTFDRDTDGNGIPESWTQYSSGSGTAATISIEENDEGVFAGERVLKISKPVSSQKTEDGIRQTVYFAKSTVNTVTAYFYSPSSAIVRVYSGGLTGTTFTQVTLSPGVITPVSISGTQSGSTMTAQISIAVMNGWSGGDVYVSFVHAEPKPVDNSVSVGTIPTTIGKDRLSNFSPGGVTYVNTELQSSNDRGLTWISVFDQRAIGSLSSTSLADVQIFQYHHELVYDYLEKLGVDIWFRARQFFQYIDPSTGSVLTVSSQWSKIMRGNQLTAITVGGWLKSSSDPSLNRFLQITSSRIEKTVQKTKVTLYPLNSTKAIVRSGAKRAVSIPFSFYCKTETDKQDVRNILDEDSTMFFQLPKFSAFVNLSGDYQEQEFVTVDTEDNDDTVISGVFQEVRTPTR